MRHKNSQPKRKWTDPETALAAVAILLLSGLIAAGIDGALKGGLLTVIGYLFGRPMLAEILKK